MHITGPAGWADTNGWRFVETGRLVATDEENSPIINPDGIEMELFCDTFATEEEGLAYMKSTRGGAAPMDIAAPEPMPAK